MPNESFVYPIQIELTHNFEQYFYENYKSLSS